MPVKSVVAAKPVLAVSAGVKQLVEPLIVSVVEKSSEPAVETVEPPKKIKKIYETQNRRKWTTRVHYDKSGKQWSTNYLQCEYCFKEFPYQKAYSRHLQLCLKEPKTHPCRWCPFIQSHSNLGQHLKYRCTGVEGVKYEAVGELLEIRRNWEAMGNTLQSKPASQVPKLQNPPN